MALAQKERAQHPSEGQARPASCEPFGCLDGPGANGGWPDFIRLWSADLNRLAMCDVVQQLANLSGLFSLRNVR